MIFFIRSSCGVLSNIMQLFTFTHGISDSIRDSVPACCRQAAQGCAAKISDVSHWFWSKVEIAFSPCVLWWIEDGFIRASSRSHACGFLEKIRAMEWRFIKRVGRKTSMVMTMTSVICRIRSPRPKNIPRSMQRCWFNTAVIALALARHAASVSIWTGSLDP